MTRLYWSGLALVVAGMLAALGWMVLLRGEADQFAQCRTGVVAGGAGQIGGPFELIDHHGQTVNDEDVITMPSIIYFGYTFCPDVCPLDVARNALAVELLEEDGHMAQPVFISVDPRRDTPEVLEEFASIFHPRMIGLTGSDEQVRAVSRAYRTFFQVQPADDEFYLVDHSTHSYLVLPGHGFVEFFPRSLDARQIAERSACFIERM
ncbi:MAG: SCO family protein [Pararhodobacter sp.]|nr:SCO family protein [Pararhodobacter sp.]